jgi:hypothetical protein
VFERCDGERTPELIASETGFDEELVLLALAKLQRLGLLEADPGISRSRFVKRAGLVAAVALPAITSLAVPAAASAQSCLPEGASCSANEECCSLNCASGVCGPEL